MKPETAGKVKFGILGLICGVAIPMIIGFGWGGWTTRGTTQKMSDDAVLASQATICVAQFMREANHKEKLQELGKIDSWKIPEFVEKGGWDRMPGQEKAVSYVAQACARGIETLIIK